MLWTSGDWDDYELVDCSDGERLERWGDYLIVRPDPQVVWSTKKAHRGWFKPDAKYTRSSSGGGQWSENELPPRWNVRYRKNTFQAGLMNFKHLGIFPEQASNWDFIADSIKRSERELEVLNLFAYTGCATVCAAAAGARVCHVDAARGMVTWARENAILSKADELPVRWIVDDCAKFIAREQRRGRRYDAVIMDPPAYGRGPSGEIWKLEDGLFDLVRSCVDILSETPRFLVLNTYSTGISAQSLGYLLGSLIVPKFGGTVECGELGLKCSQTGLVLPSGSCARWISKS